MTPFQFSLDPPAHWQEICTARGALFHAPSWQRLLETAFKSVSIYGWDPGTEIGFAISVFKAGPFRIGYLGFPAGGIVGPTPFQSETITGWDTARFPARLDCLRLPVSGFAPAATLRLPASENPETAIVALQQWEPQDLPKLRRDLNKARRSPIIVEHATEPTLGKTFEQLYRATVTRHGGQIRYNEKYFSLLIELSRNHPGLRCFVAKHGNNIAGFTVAALHGENAYYLHGAGHPDFIHYGTSDLLLHDTITWAKTQSARCFNMMASPPGQTTLIRYKEKWGAETRCHKTYTLPLRTLAYTGFRIAETLHGTLHKTFARIKSSLWKG